ncbi:MAG: ParB/RepB/Spo0J family partition protein [candidate division Zixibacteria bacterium]|nr:ParB/RepB/Spo0J family partition protein [candidate division Zixibacteria bacterium]
MKKVVLGRGLDALIPTESTKQVDDRKFKTVVLDRIAPNPMQPRRDFDDEALQQLAASLTRDGVMQPLVVVQNGSTFTIIAGERRFRAARLAGLNEVPVVVMKDIDEGRMLELALIENLQREDLNAIEAAEAYRSLMEKCNHTQSELASHVGKSRTAVANAIRLLLLPESIKQLVRAGRLSEGHARTMLALDNEVEMLHLARRIEEESMSVRDVERHTTRVRRRPATRRRVPAIAEMESYLKQLMGTSVRIVTGRKKGRIEIEYYGTDDLNRLLEMFQKLG